MRKLNSAWLWLWDVLTGGLHLRRWFVYGNDLYVLPGAGNANDNLSFNTATVFDVGYWLRNRTFSL